MPAPRSMAGGRACRSTARGFSLIEVLASITILALLTTLALPSFADWMRNTRLRSTAESLGADLQTARTEAIRRNSATRLQLVTTIDNGCALSTSGPYWVTNLGTSVSPAALCASAIGDTASPYLLQRSPDLSNGTSAVRLSATRSVVGFDALGRQTATTNPVSAQATLTIQVTSSAGTCVAAGGTIRCLNVVVSPGGDSRICDPSRTNTTDPMSC